MEGKQLKIAKVVGSVWATKKDEHLNGQKLLVLKVLENEHVQKSGFTVAADIVGAGVGDLVLVVHGGAARQAIRDQQSPIDQAIVGIVDTIEVKQDE